MKRWLWLLSGLLALAVACAPRPDDAGTMMALATPSPRITPTATPDTVGMIYDLNVSQATAQAAQATAAWLASQATATAARQSAIQTATAEAQQAAATRQAAAIAATSTARSWQATATADSVQATSTAAVSQTAQAFALAATESAWHATATALQAESSAYATAMAGEAESARLAVQRQQQTNTVKAAAPWVLLLGTFLVVALIAIRRANVMLVSRDERGDAKLLIMGGRFVIDPDRNPAPVLDVGGSKPSLPIKADAATTARDQAIDLAHRGLPGQPSRRAAARKQAQVLFPDTEDAPGVSISLVPPAQVGKAIQDVAAPIMLDVLDGEVKEGEL